MEQITITINNMADVRREIDNCQRKAMTSVVELGYILRKADDAGLYKEQGYASIFKFAEAEYGWSQSQTSRFMNINREFSEGGYSTTLKDQYKEFGQAKLAEMLTLPESIREELEPAMKRSEIREIKTQFRETGQEGKENAFEAAVYDGQEEGGIQAAVENLFSQPEMVKKLKNLYPYMQKEAEGSPTEDEDIRMVVSSTGFGTARAGAVMFFWKKENICMIRGDQKTTCPYRGFLALLNKLQDPRGIPVGEWYRNVYGKDLPVPSEEKEEKTDKGKTASGIETSTNTGKSGDEKEEDTTCPYCSGKRSIQSNDAAFWLTLHENGLARIGNDTATAVMEFDCCPKCGKELKHES